jgi:flagellar protein FliO/FliZ
MQALVERISENRSLTFVAWAIALLLAAALILFIFRLAFGRRLKAPSGGRARMPRLGVVDAFDLDRHRQLVIVRRDNVEHLLMIGGPNDLVIESEIIRAEGREVRLRDNAREKEAREAPLTPVAAPAQPPIAPPVAPPWQPELEPALARAGQPQPPRKTPIAPIPPLAPTAPALQAEADAPAPVVDEPIAPIPPLAPAAPPAPRAPAFPLPPRRIAQPLTAGRGPREPSSRPDFASRIEPTAGSAGTFQRAPLATPFVRTLPRQLTDPKSAAAPARRDGESAVPAADGAAPGVASAPPVGVSAPMPETASPVSADAPAPSQTPPDPPAADKFADEANLAIDSLDQSLEEEMARLLGRGT